MRRPFGEIAAKDFIGQTTWSPLVSRTGWRLGDKASWPTVFNYGDPRFVKTMDWVRSLENKGYAPKIGEFTTSVSDVDLLSSGKVALEMGVSWEASTFAKIPGVKTGIAPTPYGPDGTTRAVMSNSNGNNVWAGTKNPDLTWKWVSYMGSESCQSKASQTGTFFPSIPAAMDSSAKALASQGVDLSVFTDMLKDKVLYPSPVYGNGAAIQDAMDRCSRGTSPGRRATPSSPVCRTRARPCSRRTEHTKQTVSVRRTRPEGGRPAGRANERTPNG
jgi:multiple sugar transport system substrate-binding protein